MPDRNVILDRSFIKKLKKVTLSLWEQCSSKPNKKAEGKNVTQVKYALLVINPFNAEIDKSALGDITINALQLKSVCIDLYVA